MNDTDLMNQHSLILCEKQGNLFAASRSLSCSSAIFIRRFMLSDYAKEIDQNSVSLTFEDGECFSALIQQFGPFQYGKEKFSTEELFWIGYLYRYWSIIRHSSSRWVYRVANAKEMRQVFYPYHSLDPAAAIERILDDKGLSEDKTKERALALMKEIRQKNSSR